MRYNLCFFLNIFKCIQNILGGYIYIQPMSCLPFSQHRNQSDPSKNPSQHSNIPGTKRWMVGIQQMQTATEVGEMIVIQENCTFYFFICLENFILQGLNVIRPKSGGSFLKTLQWLPISQQKPQSLKLSPKSSTSVPPPWLHQKQPASTLTISV